MLPRPHFTTSAAAHTSGAVNSSSGVWRHRIPCVAAALVVIWALESSVRIKLPTALVSARSRSVEAAQRHQVWDDVERLMLNSTMPFSRASLDEDARWHRGIQRDHHDSGEWYRLLALPQRKLYVVGWRPLVGRHHCPDDSIVEFIHHLNLVGTSAERAKAEFRHGVGTIKRIFGQTDHKHFVASFDRGSMAYHFPDGVGLAIGPGTLCEALVLEYHFLVPPCWDFDRQPVVTDQSGFELLLTRKRPQRLAAIVGFTDEHMNLKPGQGIVDKVSIAPPNKMRHLFFYPSTDGVKDEVHRLAKGSSLELIAMHLHTHAFSGSKWFEILDEKGTVVFVSKEEPAGYGPELQSMFNLPDMGWPQLMLQPGVTLKQHCGYDTNKLTHELVDGVGHGEEMCAALFVVAGYTEERHIPATIFSLETGEVLPRAAGSVPKFFDKKREYGF